MATFLTFLDSVSKPSGLVTIKKIMMIFDGVSTKSCDFDLKRRNSGREAGGPSDHLEIQIQCVMDRISRL